MIDLNMPEIGFALRAVGKAAWLARQVQRELVSPALTKDDRSPVTVADFAIQAVVGCLLLQAFPGGCLVAEEDSSALRNPKNGRTLELVAAFASRLLPEATPDLICEWIDYGQGKPAGSFWTLDPVDGTKGFLRKEHYAVALAYIVDGQVQVGVLGCPNLAETSHTDKDGTGSLVIAARGQGSWMTPLFGVGSWQVTMDTANGMSFQRLYVSTLSDPTQARILRSVESGHTNVGQIDEFSQALGVQILPQHMDSQAKYVILAASHGDLYLRLLSPDQPDYREKIWDQAAGSLILEEAGGRITDLDGLPLDFTTGRSLNHNRGILASNGLLHTAALRALISVGA